MWRRSPPAGDPGGGAPAIGRGAGLGRRGGARRARRPRLVRGDREQGAPVSRSRRCTTLRPGDRSAHSPPCGARRPTTDSVAGLRPWQLRRVERTPMSQTTAQHDQAERLDAIRRMAEGFQSRIAAHDRDASFPRENFDELRAAGLLGLTIPEEDGGHGLWWGDRYREYYELLETLAQVDSATAQLLQVHCHATGFIFRHATSAQREGVLRDIAANGRLVASVGSETNPRSTRSGDYVAELTPVGDDWRLTCNKFFASMAPAADYLLLWVAVPGEQSYPERTVTVLVPRDAAEVELIDQWDVMGMRPTVSWSVRIHDHPVSADAVFGAPGAWVRDDPRTFTLGFAANH
ncbi:MAG: acyl-CoA dehydrogenase, partial [Chloroflexi bacterium]